MDFRIVRLSTLNPEQIGQVALLHQRTIHSLLADLGLALVKRYYENLSRDQSAIGLCAINETGAVRGWASGSPNPERVNRSVSRPLSWFAPRILGALIARPMLLRQLFASARAVSQPLPAGVIELTYIGVESSVRKKGLGRALLVAFLREAGEQGYRSVALSVEAENNDALSLYTGEGFEIVKSLQEGKFERYRMEAHLGNEHIL